MMQTPSKRYPGGPEPCLADLCGQVWLPGVAALHGGHQLLLAARQATLHKSQLSFNFSALSQLGFLFSAPITSRLSFLCTNHNSAFISLHQSQLSFHPSASVTTKLSFFCTNHSSAFITLHQSQLSFHSSAPVTAQIKLLCTNHSSNLITLHQSQISFPCPALKKMTVKDEVLGNM
jgi:hypothetical protein